MYRKKVKVMPSEAACTNEIKIRALLNRLQDVASLAVANLEGSPGELAQRGYAWVLLRYRLEVGKRLPTMDEPIVIETRHTVNDGLHTLRAFRVFAEGNEAETLLLAKTSWVLIDLAAGRPVRALQHLPEVFHDVADDPPIDPEFAAIPKLSDAALKNVSFLCETEFSVRFHDLDANGHVNNAAYFEWMYEATPLDLMGWELRAADAEFRVSAKFGEVVRVRVKSLDPEVGSEEPAKPGERIRVFAYDMVRAGEGEFPLKAPPLACFYAVWAPLS